MRPVYTLKDQVEENIVAGALGEAGIKFIIRPFSDTAYDGIFVAQKGYGLVMVEEEDKFEAEEIIKGALLNSN